MARKTIALIGFPGAGKTSVGKLLHEKYRWSWADLDERIERLAGASVTSIIRVEGEQRFRELERRALAQLLAEQPDVISLGGGALLSDHNRAEVSEKAFVVHLAVSFEEALQRIAEQEKQALESGGQAVRPLLSNDNQTSLDSLSKEVRRLMDKRQGIYDFAHLCINTDSQQPEQVADYLVTQRDKLLFNFCK